MISTLTGSGSGPISGYIAHANLTTSSTVEGRSYLSIFTYRKNVLAPAMIANPTPDFSQRLSYLAFSNNANYLLASTGSGSGTNHLKIFSRSGNTFTSLSIPGLTSNQQYNSASISSSGEYFAAGPHVWHNNSGSLTKLTTTGVSNYAAISPDGSFLASYAYVNPNYVIVISKRSGSGNAATYATHQNIALTSSRNPRVLQFSKTGNYLAVGFNQAPLFSIYKYNSATDQWDALNQPPSGGTMPASEPSAVFWALDDSLVGVSTSSQSLIYERSGDSFIHRATIADSSGYLGGFHPSNNYFITGGGNIYRKITNSNWQFLTSINFFVSGSNPSTYAAFGSTFSPYIL